MSMHSRLFSLAVKVPSSTALPPTHFYCAEKSTGRLANLCATPDGVRRNEDLATSDYGLMVHCGRTKNEDKAVGLNIAQASIMERKKVRERGREEMETNKRKKDEGRGGQAGIQAERCERGFHYYDLSKP